VHAPTASWCRRTAGPGLTGRGRLAVRGDAGDRPGLRPVSRAGPVAGAPGGPRPGKVIADLRLRLAERWPWAGEFAAAVTRLQALPSVLPVPTATMTRKGNTRAAEPRPPGATAGHPGMGDPLRAARAFPHARTAIKFRQVKPQGTGHLTAQGSLPGPAAADNVNALRPGRPAVLRRTSLHHVKPAGKPVIHRYHPVPGRGNIP
jgi:hypothetical protein